jgi:hypothetical protein
MCSRPLLLICFWFSSLREAASFTGIHPHIHNARVVGQKNQGHVLFYSDRDKNYLHNDKNSNNRDDSFDAESLQQRLDLLRVRNLEEDYRRPPNPHLSPIEFIQACLHCLWSNDDPLPDSGFRLLLRASTKDWRKQLRRSVGAPVTAHEEVVASALGYAIARPNNQFAILVGEAESYVATFPTDPLEYADDGTCWVECQFRGANDGKLLVITGWQLHKENGAWMVDNIDWQDFRDAFRPGIGREEWMRICG